MREQGTPLGHMAWSGVSSACIGLGVIMHCHDIRVILFANNFGAKEFGVLWLDLSQLDHLGYHLQALPSSDRALLDNSKRTRAELFTRLDHASPQEHK